MAVKYIPSLLPDQKHPRLQIGHVIRMSDDHFSMMEPAQLIFFKLEKWCFFRDFLQPNRQFLQKNRMSLELQYSLRLFDVSC